MNEDKQFIVDLGSIPEEQTIEGFLDSPVATTGTSNNSNSPVSVRDWVAVETPSGPAWYSEAEERAQREFLSTKPITRFPIRDEAYGATSKAWNSAEPSLHSFATGNPIVYGTAGVVGVTTPTNRWPTNADHSNTLTMVEEISLREKAIEATIKAFGYKEVTMEEFSNLLDYFYNYLKFGTKTQF